MALAEGLPVVVPNGDGYRVTVRHEVDGLRAPTLAPAPGLLGDLSYRHALGIDTYDMYCGHSSSFVAVDANALASSFTALFSSPALREKMGQAGRNRARTDYDWKTTTHPTIKSLKSTANAIHFFVRRAEMIYCTFYKRE